MYLYSDISYFLGTKFSEDCYRYGVENPATDAILAKTSALYGGAIKNIVTEHEDLSSFLSSQVSVLKFKSLELFDMII